MVRFVIGRSGSGKTEYCFSKIKEAVAEGQAEGEKQVLLITPEQYNFTAQKRLLKDLGESGINCVENSSFSRLYREVVRLQGGAAEEISNGTKVVMMKKAISNANAKTKLEIIDVEKMHPSFVKSLLQLYQEIKDYGNTINQISDAAGSLPPEEVELSSKLCDIAKIFTEYEKLLGDLQLDPACRLEELCRQFTSTNGSYLAGRVAFIDGFSMFTESEYKIIELIFKYCKDVTVTLCMDPDSQSAANKGYGLFGNVGGTYERLKNIAEHIGCEIPNDNIISLNENKRTEKEDLKFIEKNLFSHIDNQFDKDPQDIEIYSSKGMADECKYVSLSICKLLREKTPEVHPGNIAVICRNKSNYETELMHDFSKYNIPYYIDESPVISKQPLMVFIHYLLNVVIYGFRSEDIISMARTGITGRFSFEKMYLLDSLDNYVYTWGIDGYEQWSNTFTAPPGGLKRRPEVKTDDPDESTVADDETANDAENESSTEKGEEKKNKVLERIDESRNYLFTILDEFKTNIENAKTAKDIGTAIYNVLYNTKKENGFGVNGILMKRYALKFNEKEDDTQLFSAQGKSWKLAMDVMEKIANIFGDTEISIEEYAELFETMVAAEDYTSAPQRLNNVLFMSADKISTGSCKYVFILGANEDEFPAAFKETGILTSGDRRCLNSHIKSGDIMLHLQPSADKMNLQERYFAYQAASLASEGLTVCYCGAGGDTVPSSLVTSLKEIFSDISEKKAIDSENEIDLIESESSALELMASHFEEDNTFYASLKEYFSEKENEKYNSLKRLSKNAGYELKNKETATELFGKDMRLSASKMEDFYKCPFLYFCNYGLNAIPLSKAQLDNLSIGTITHYVLEKLLNGMDSEKFNNMDDEETKTSIRDIIKNYFVEEVEFSPEVLHNLDRLADSAFSVVQHIKKEFTQEGFGFKTVGCEVFIPTEGEIEPYVNNLDDGGSVTITGKIDRIDTYEKDGKKYVRVVDYKTGKKDFNIANILDGINLQMLIYLSAICRKPVETSAEEATHGEEDSSAVNSGETNTENNKYNGIPAGILYMHAFRDDVDLTSSSITCETGEKFEDSAKKACEEELDEKYKMSGIVLNEDNALKAMEPGLADKYIPVAGPVNDETESAVTSGQFETIFKKVDQMIIQMGTDLHNGKIMQHPIESGDSRYPTCGNCNYKKICDLKKEKPEERTRSNEKKKNVLQKISAGVNKQ